MRRLSGRCGERGSLAVELVVAAPLLLALLGLVYGYGRVAQVSGTLEAGTRDAARTATQARSAAEALAVAQSTVRTSLPAGPCRSSLQVQLRDGRFRPGEPVTVDATCSYRLRDVLPGVPGLITARSTFSSPLDPNRGVG